MNKNTLLFIFIVCFCSIPLHAMKILFVVASFPVLSETFILNQLTGLVDRGHEVYVYSTHKLEVPMFHKHLEPYHLHKRTFYRTLPKDFYADIVMCQFGQGYETYLELKNEYHLHTKKVITCFRGSDALEALNSKPKKAYYKTLFRECDLIMPVCNHLKELLVEAGCNPKKILVHHSSIDCTKFTFKPRTLMDGETIRIVTTGRLVEKKGIEYAIRAVALVKNIYPNISYTIIGEGNMHNRFQAVINSLGMQDTISMVGQQNQAYIIDALDKAHIFILSSITAFGNIEGIANALKEAMAMGIPSIGTYHSGTPELITHKESGLLVQERNSPELAEAITYLIEHPEIWIPMGIAARQKIEQEFEIEKENDNLVRILKNLLR